MVSIKPILKCSDDDKKNFRKSQCLLTISVGQEAHEGEKFASTIELVNNSFESCIILIDDSLQRHTMALMSDKGADYFYKKSIDEGNAWLHRNKKFYEKLSILNKIIRWDLWLYHKDFFAQQKIIKDLLVSSEQYKKAFGDTIDEFLTRYTRRLSSYNGFNSKKAYLLCMDYLIEECTALCLWKELQCQYEVYPGKRNFAMIKTHERFILDTNLSLLHAVYIKFKNKKQLSPQNFNLLEKDLMPI